MAASQPRRVPGATVPSTPEDTPSGAPAREAETEFESVSAEAGANGCGRLALVLRVHSGGVSPRHVALLAAGLEQRSHADGRQKQTTVFLFLFFCFFRAKLPSSRWTSIYYLNLGICSSFDSAVGWLKAYLPTTHPHIASWSLLPICRLIDCFA